MSADIRWKHRITSQIVARVKALREEESPIPYLFDVVDYHTIETPAFKTHIDTHGKSIYKKQ